MRVSVKNAEWCKDCEHKKVCAEAWGTPLSYGGLAIPRCDSCKGEGKRKYCNECSGLHDKENCNFRPKRK